MTFQEFWHSLTPLYDDSEARSIARLVMERRFGLSMADIACGAVEHVESQALADVCSRLKLGEPVQYVLGEADFCGRTFHVGPGVLIPRPETEWLCRKAVELLRGRHGGAILDIGTGSGCIACTVALGLERGEERWEVVAWDISDRAIAIALDNVAVLGAHVAVEKADALNPPDDSRRWDVIVSNPPYICLSERGAMHENVLRHEPAEALFVPDDDPLLFYRAIAEYALHALKPDGMLLFEINPAYADDLRLMAASLGFASVTIEKDYFGKRRYAVITSFPIIKYPLKNNLARFSY